MGMAMGQLNQNSNGQLGSQGLAVRFRIEGMIVASRAGPSRDIKSPTVSLMETMSQKMVCRRRRRGRRAGQIKSPAVGLMEHMLQKRVCGRRGREGLWGRGGGGWRGSRCRAGML